MPRKMTLAERITRALDAAGRPLIRTEITSWFLNSVRGPVVEAELARMVADGELVDLGEVPAPRNGAPGHDRRPRKLYGLPPVAIRLQTPRRPCR